MKNPTSYFIHLFNVFIICYVTVSVLTIDRQRLTKETMATHLRVCILIVQKANFKLSYTNKHTIKYSNKVYDEKVKYINKEDGKI